MKHEALSRSQKPKIGILVVLATLSLNVLALAMPLVVLQIFDRVITNQSFATLGMLVVGLFCVIVFETILRTARLVLLSFVSERYENELTGAYVSRALAADPLQYAKTTEAEHLERFKSIGHLRDYYAGQGRLAMLEMPFALIFILTIGLIGGWLVLVPIIGVLLLLKFTKTLVHYQEPIVAERNGLDARRYAFLMEVLSQIRPIKLNTMEPQLLRRFEMMQDKTFENSRKTIQHSGISQSFGAVYSQGALVAMGLFGGFLVVQGSIGIAELAACMLLNGRTIQPFVKMLGVWAQSESIASSERKLAAALSLSVPENSLASNQQLERGDIQLDRVTVQFPDASAPVFHELTASISAGDHVSILGTDGAGKSTLLKAINGEVAPTGGQILIGGAPQAGGWPPKGRDGIVMVGFQPEVFNGTILQNVSAFGDGLQIERALSLSQRFDLETRIHALPLGYDTVIGDAAAFALDQSALKLVSLVRALSMTPQILLLQDPTYGCDAETGEVLAKVLSEQLDDMTIVMSTHDERLIEASDSIIRLEDTQPSEWIEDALSDQAPEFKIQVAS